MTLKSTCGCLLQKSTWQEQAIRSELTKCLLSKRLELGWTLRPSGSSIRSPHSPGTITNAVNVSPQEFNFVGAAVDEIAAGVVGVATSMRQVVMGQL